MSENSADQGKRSFVQILLGISGLATLGGFAYAVLNYLATPKETGGNEDTIVLGKVDSIVGNPKWKNDSFIFKFQRKPAILVKTPAGNFRAFSAECTHLQCTVEHKPGDKVFFCNCHGGKYNLDGKNIAGPPPLPLEEYDVDNNNGELTVSVRKA